MRRRIRRFLLRLLSAVDEGYANTLQGQIEGYESAIEMNHSHAKDRLVAAKLMSTGSMEYQIEKRIRVREAEYTERNAMTDLEMVYSFRQVREGMEAYR